MGGKQMGSLMKRETRRLKAEKIANLILLDLDEDENVLYLAKAYLDLLEKERSKKISQEGISSVPPCEGRVAAPKKTKDTLRHYAKHGIGGFGGFPDD